MYTFNVFKDCIAKLSRCSSSSKHNTFKGDWRTRSFQESNNTSKTDLTPVEFEPQSPREQIMQKSFPNPTERHLSLPDTKNPEPSLPHLYEKREGTETLAHKP